MPTISQFAPFKEEEYFKTARQLISGSEEDYPRKLLEGIAKQLKNYLNPENFREFVADQWEIWSLSNAMSNLDYLLKDPKTARKLELVPFLPSRVITAKKILYHGGYCKQIYPSWNNYIETGKKKLSSRLTKYHNTIQSIHGWYN